MLLPGFVPLQNLPGKTTTPNQERKLPIKQQITIKSIPERTQKTSVSITPPLALPLPDYDEPMLKDVGIQNDSARFELLDHDYSHNYTDTAQKMKFSI